MAASPCIDGIGSLNIRTGYIHVGGDMAHRVAWLETHGEIPPGMELHHTCFNRACANVGHLQLVTRKQHREIHAGAQTHCWRGHTLKDAYITPRGKRQCRTCQRERVRRHAERKRLLA